MSRKRRTEALSVHFVDRLAEGWFFLVGDYFRMQLDIRLDERIDTAASKAKQERLGRKLEPSEKVKRRVWTQGDPPAYSFDRGQLFHEVKETKEGVRRSITVLRSRADPGALVETQVVDENGIETTVVVDAKADSAAAGFVDYEVISYKNGVLITDEIGLAIKEQSSLTQASFVELLRIGQ